MDDVIKAHDAEQAVRFTKLEEMNARILEITQDITETKSRAAGAVGKPNMDSYIRGQVVHPAGADAPEEVVAIAVPETPAESAASEVHEAPIVAVAEADANPTSAGDAHARIRTPVQLQTTHTDTA